MSEPGTYKKLDPARFAKEPDLMMWQTREQSLTMDPQKLQEIQLEGLRNRFNLLKDKVPVLARLAEEQSIDEIRTIEDGAKLLFKHSVYKSYPISLIEKNRFDKLTDWLSNLTTCDLSMVDTAGITSIDGWLDAIEAQSGVLVIHSTGTSGKLSFAPRGAHERALLLRAFRLCYGEAGEKEGMEKSSIVVPTHRKMYNSYGAMIDVAVKELFNGDESRVVTLDPGRLSADILSLGGRLAALRDKGGALEGQIPASLLARRDEFIREQKEGPARRAAFYETVLKRLQGTRVVLTGNWTMLYEMAEEGIAQGFTKVFAPDSLVMTAGGNKGRVLPANHKEVVKEFLGVEHITEGYGMSEIGNIMPLCEAGQYHAMPWMILYLLDGKTGEELPRSGTQTGRLGIIDLVSMTYWGGILSGDEVTVQFGKCACGRSGPTLSTNIRRYSEMEGGDDKITCAGAPEAHDNALAFLAELEV